MIDLEYFNIKIDRSEKTNEILIKGEVSNRGDTNYSTVALRVILFIKHIPIANVIVLVNGLGARMTKSFEKTLEDLRYDVIAKEITRHEIYVESAY